MQELLIDRVAIRRDYNYCQLIIPVKRDFIAKVMSGFGVIILSVVGISFLSHNFSRDFKADLFDILIDVAVPVILLAILRVFLWNTTGKEIVTITDGLLKIETSWMLFKKPGIYNLNKVKNLRTDFDTESYEDTKWDNSSYTLGSSSRLTLSIRLSGTFLFDYEGATIKFGDSVDKDDADLILMKLKDLRIILVSNLAA